MDIAMICTEKLPVPPVAGGAVQLYIEGVVPYLSEQHKITVYGIQYPGLQDDETKDNIRYVRVPGKNDAVYVANLKEKVVKDHDIIHVFNRPKTVLALMDEFPQAKFSLSLHNEMFHPEKISEENGVKCIERVEFINTVSKFIARGVENRFPQAAGKLHVVYSGADIEAYKTNWSEEGLKNRKALKEKLDLKDRKVVLFVTRFSKKKGVHIVLEAMKTVMEQNHGTALVVVGSKWYGKNEADDYTNMVMKLAKSLKGHIVFTGFIPPAEIPAYYNIGDVFVCASQWNEPLARVHFEAMAAGLPIVTTDRGGNAEVVEDGMNGLVVEDCKDSGMMAEKIDFLLKNPDKAQEIGRNGRQLAEEKYNWKRVAGEVFKSVESPGSDEQSVESP